MLTTTLLPYASVTTYDLKRNARSKTFATEADARKWIAESGSKCFNLYRIDKVNGTWRTDWELERERLAADIAEGNRQALCLEA